VTFDQAIKNLAEDGLNIFASCKTANLPEPLRAQLSTHRSVVLIGNGGRRLWERLPKPVDEHQHPFDRFAVERVKSFDPGAEIIYPSSQVVAPLQQLARALNISRPSKLGLDIHPVYGPWFAFRAAFLTDAEIPEVIHQPFASPCESCSAKPCISACPVEAVSDGKFHLSTCADHRLAEGSPCLERCFSRQACPVGSAHRYSDEQQRYHMTRILHLANLNLRRTISREPNLR